LQIYAETDEDRDPLDVSILPANEALILAALGLRSSRVRGNQNGGNVVLCPYEISDSLTQRFPIWVPSEVMKEAKALSVAEAESILSPWLSLVGRACARAAQVERIV
jgi:hypothetical protein